MDAIEAMKSMFKSIMEGKVQWDRDVFRLGLKALVETDYCDAIGLSQINADDILNWEGLVESLKLRQCPYKSHLLKSLAPKCQKEIDNYDPAIPVELSLKKSLISALNALLDRKEFYEPDLFRKVKLPEEFTILYNKGIENLDVIFVQKLNRILIDSIFSGKIKKRKPGAFESIYKHITSTGFKDFINNKGSDLRLQVPGRHLRVLGYFFCAACAVEIRNLGKVVYSDEAARYFAGMASRLLSGIDLAEETESLLEFPFTGSASTTGSVKSSSWNDFQELTNRIFSLAREEYDREIREEEKKDLQISEAKAFTSYLLTADEEYSRKEAERLLRWREYPVLFVNGTMGILGTIRVEMLKDGIGDFYSKSQKMFYINADSDFLASIQTAWKYARTKLPEGVEHIDVVWDIRTADFRHIFCDKSAGAPTALATRQLLLNEPLPNDYLTFFTGEVYKSGKIGEVGGITEKITAALRKDVKIIILPQENWKTLGGKLKNSKMANYIDLRNEINSKLGGLDNIKPVNTVDEAAQYASGLPKKVKEYLEWMKGESEKLNILKRLEKQIKLEDIYIPVSTAQWEKHDKQEERINEGRRFKGDYSREREAYARDPHDRSERKNDNKERETIVPWAQKRNNFKGGAILGDPGQGKSTLLRWEWNTLAREGLEKLHKGVKLVDIKIPFFIHLAQLARVLAENETKGEPFNFLESCILSGIPGEEFQNRQFYDYICRQVKSGQAVFLLDALDECSDREKYLLNIHLRAFQRDYSQCSFILTSRIVGYDSCPFQEQSKPLTLAPFTHRDQERFAQSWFTSDETDGKARAFMRTLRKNLEMRGLAGNPLLLTLMCKIYEENPEGEIHQSRGQLYEECIAKFLTDWKTTKNVGSVGVCNDNHFAKHTLEAKWEIYSDIAFYFFSRKIDIFTRKELNDFIFFHPGTCNFTGPPRFNESSIMDWERFLYGLKNRGIGDKKRQCVFDYLLECKDSISRLPNPDETDKDSITSIIDGLKKDVASELNIILNRKNFYNEDIFGEPGGYRVMDDEGEFNINSLSTDERTLFNYRVLLSIFPDLFRNIHIDEILADGILVPATYGDTPQEYPDKYMFIHRTFQEYLTARMLAEEPIFEIQYNDKKNEENPMYYLIFDIARWRKEGAPSASMSSSQRKGSPLLCKYPSNITLTNYKTGDPLTTIHFIEANLWDWEWWEEVLLLLCNRYYRIYINAQHNTSSIMNQRPKNNQANDVVEMLLRHDDHRLWEEIFDDKGYYPRTRYCPGKDPTRKILFLSAKCCGQGKVSGDVNNKAMDRLDDILGSWSWPVTIKDFAIEAMGFTLSKSAEKKLNSIRLKSIYHDDSETWIKTIEAIYQIDSNTIINNLLDIIQKGKEHTFYYDAFYFILENEIEVIEPFIFDNIDKGIILKEELKGLKAMVKTGSKKAIGTLQDLINNEEVNDKDFKEFLFEILNEVHDEQINLFIPFLIQCSRNSNIGWQAQKILINIGSDKIVVDVINELEKGVNSTSESLIEILSHIHTEKAFNYLNEIAKKRLFKLPDNMEMIYFAKAGIIDVLPDILKILKNGQSRTLDYAIEALYILLENEESVLRNIQMKNLNDLLQTIGDIIDNEDYEHYMTPNYLSLILDNIGKHLNIEAFLKEKIEGDIDKKLRFYLMIKLRRLYGDNFCEYLINILKRKKLDWESRRDLLKVLGMYPTERGEDILIEHLYHDNYYDVRQYAAFGLGKIASEKSLKALIKALTSDKWTVHILDALGVIGSAEAVPIIGKKMGDWYRGWSSLTDEFSIKTATKALGNIKSVEAIQYIEEAGDRLLGKHYYHITVIDSLEKIGTREVLPLLYKMNGSKYYSLSAYKSLGRVFRKLRNKYKMMNPFDPWRKEKRLQLDKLIFILNQIKEMK